MLLAHGESAATAIEAVEAQTEVQLREGSFECGGQTVKGLEFAVLLFLLVIGRSEARRVLDKFAG